MAAVKNFRISRASSASRGDASHDPFTKLVFEPALESDELFDALREAYPTVKTHTERKKQAVLDFLMDERQAIEQEITAFVHGTGVAAPVDAFSPQDDASPLNPPFVRNPSTSCSGDESFSSSAAPSSAESSPETLSLKQMTSVWTATGDAPPKIHHRRSMTTKEKEEYRKRRQMKACQECRSRKRKCNHDTAASSRVTSKVKKRSKTPQHNTSSESSFQLEGSSVWDEPSLMGSVLESPLNFTDFGPPPPAGIEGFEDFLLLPEDDEFSMAFSPDPLFSTATTMAPQNNTFTTYAEPQQPTHSFTAWYESYAQSVGSSPSTAASAFSSPGRATAPANASIAPAQMIQSSQNWDMDLAGHGVNMDLSGGNPHGQVPVPMVDTIPSGSSGGGRVDDATLHNVLQPEPSRGRRPAATATSSSALSQRPLPRPGAQSLLTESDPAPAHTCEGVGTARFSASAANTPAFTRTSNGNSPSVLTNNNTSSSSAPTTGLVSYAPSSFTTRTTRCTTASVASSETSDRESASADAGRNSASALRRVGALSKRNSGRDVLYQSGVAAPITTQTSPVLASPVTFTQTAASLSMGDINETAAQPPNNELLVQSPNQKQNQRDSASNNGSSSSLCSALANTTASTILLSVVALAAFFLFPASSAVTTATPTRRSPKMILALTHLVFFALSYARHVGTLLSSLAGTASLLFCSAVPPPSSCSSSVDAPLCGPVRTGVPSLHSRLRALGVPKLSQPLASEKPTPHCERVPWRFARALPLV